MIFIKSNPEIELYLLKLDYDDFIKAIAIKRMYYDPEYILCERERLANKLKHDKPKDQIKVDYIELIDEE